jgi:enoyl-CoA hydratase/carnithine racemase
MTDEHPVRVERHGARGEVVLDRPERRNAQTLDLIEQLTAGVGELVADDDIGAIVIWGEGDHFSFGLDLASLRESDPATVSEARIALHASLLDCPKPVVAVAHNISHGGSAALALSCDFVMADETAAFSWPEVAINMVAWMNLAVLRLKFDEARTLEVTLDARPFTAPELLERGLVHRVVPAGDALGAARAFADRLATFDAASISSTKRLARAVAGVDSAEDHLRRVAALARTSP